jgi:hypothetical protein
MQVGREDVLADQVGLDEDLRRQAQDHGVEIVEAGDVLVERYPSWATSRPARRSTTPPHKRSPSRRGHEKSTQR